MIRLRQAYGATGHEKGTPGALPRFRLRKAYGAIRQPPDEADSEARSAERVKPRVSPRALGKAILGGARLLNDLCHQQGLSLVTTIRVIRPATRRAVGISLGSLYQVVDQGPRLGTISGLTVPITPIHLGSCSNVESFGSLAPPSMAFPRARRLTLGFTLSALRAFQGNEFPGETGQRQDFDNFYFAHLGQRSARSSLAACFITAPTPVGNSLPYKYSPLSSSVTESS